MCKVGFSRLMDQGAWLGSKQDPQGLWERVCSLGFEYPKTPETLDPRSRAPAGIQGFMVKGLG